jgi:PAT family beta-lactamase induction signal transducer AmpG
MAMTTTTDAAIEAETTEERSPWWWVPSLYFGQGVPYVVVMTLSVIMYKNLQVSNADIALYTSWLYLPWVIKPFWSPLVDMIRTKRFWIVALQLVIGAALATVALTLHAPRYFQMTLAVFWLMAFASATHDIAADGFYMLALEQHRQAAYVGVRSTCYRIAMIAGQGGLVWLAGRLSERLHDVVTAWSVVFGVLATMFFVQFLYHRVVLPRPASDRPSGGGAGGKKTALADFVDSFVSFFKKPKIGLTLAFLLLFRFGEAQAIKLITPFLLDPNEKGGLGLRTEEVGLVYGTIGVLALTLGGLLGGIVIARHGLRRWIWFMLLATHLPLFAFVFLATTLPKSLVVVSAALALEQFGYGFGFTAYLLFMIMVSDGPRKTAHYAYCTGFMALGMMLPGMASGFIEERLGYAHFFVWVLVAALPSLVVTAFVKIDPGFGRKAAA